MDTPTIALLARVSAIVVCAVKAATIGLGERTAGAWKERQARLCAEEVAEDVGCESMELARERREGLHNASVYVCLSVERKANTSGE